MNEVVQVIVFGVRATHMQHLRMSYALRRKPAEAEVELIAYLLRLTV